MIEIQNEELFGQIIAEEIAAIHGNKSLTTWEMTRFINALAKAAARIESSGAFMDFDRAADKLLIWSDSNEIYTVNGDKTCVCKAAMNGNVCWHRAAKRLVSRYLLADQIEQTVTSHEHGTGRFRRTAWGSAEACRVCIDHAAQMEAARNQMRTLRA